MTDNYTAIILAAGKGTRLRPLTNHIPKCMVEVGGKPILEWQLEVLTEAGVDEIIVVTGYLEEKINDRRIFEKVHNNKYAETNMVYSLFCAEDYLQGNVIIGYGDIIYSKEVLNRLMDNKEDVVIASDEEWLSYWNQRCEDPLSDAETFRKKSNQKVKSLGQDPTLKKEIEGQFIGLVKLTSDGVNTFKEEYYNCQDEASCSENAWGSGRPLHKSYMTDILNYIAGVEKLSYVPIQRGWFEVDTPSDLEIADNHQKNLRI